MCLTVTSATGQMLESNQFGQRFILLQLDVDVNLSWLYNHVRNSCLTVEVPSFKYRKRTPFRNWLSNEMYCAVVNKTLIFERKIKCGVRMKHSFYKLSINIRYLHFPKQYVKTQKALNQHQRPRCSLEAHERQVNIGHSRNQTANKPTML